MRGENLASQDAKEKAVARSRLTMILLLYASSAPTAVLLHKLTLTPARLRLNFLIPYIKSSQGAVTRKSLSDPRHFGLWLPVINGKGK